MKGVLKKLNGRSSAKELERARLQCVLALVGKHNRGEIDRELAVLMQSLMEEGGE